MLEPRLVLIAVFLIVQDVTDKKVISHTLPVAALYAAPVLRACLYDSTIAWQELIRSVPVIVDVYNVYHIADVVKPNVRFSSCRSVHFNIWQGELEVKLFPKRPCMFSTHREGYHDPVWSRSLSSSWQASRATPVWEISSRMIIPRSFCALALELVSNVNDEVRSFENRMITFA